MRALSKVVHDLCRAAGGATRKAAAEGREGGKGRGPTTVDRTTRNMKMTVTLGAGASIRRIKTIRASGARAQAGPSRVGLPVPERLVHSATSALPRRRAYYSKLLSLEGDEFERFQHACREPLPSTFRLAGPFRFEIGEAIQKQFLNDMAEPFSVTIEGAETITVPPTQRLTWYPEQLAWQLTAGKRALRKGTELQPLREFLIVHTASGHITRSASRRTRLAATPSPNIGAAGRRLLA
jgi:hypothetical protein